MMKKEIIIGNNLAEITLVTSFVQEIGTSLQLPSDVVMRICLALEEAIANVVNYAYPADENHEIWLKIEIAEQEMIFTLMDNGKSLPLLKMENINKIASHEQQFGEVLGIKLIGQIMDVVTYRSGDNCNELVMRKKIDVQMITKKTMNTNICKIEDVIILTLNGRLDTANAHEFEKDITPLFTLVNPDIIVNCENFTYICSSGIRSLILLQKSIMKNNGKLVFEAMRPEILKVFQMTGCTSLFTIR